MACEEKKADEILILHTAPLTSVADYFLLASIHSPAQMEAVGEHIVGTLKQNGIRPLHAEGRSSDYWRVLDYGGVMIHLMHPDARQFYALERLYVDARTISWKKAKRSEHLRARAK